VQFRQLRYFVAVVEAGSISRAAATVHVAQPALSQQIADLEERIGVQLLLRTPRGVKATSAGETLFREASLILHRMDKLPGMLKSAIGETQGTVRLGIVASLAGPLVGVIGEHFKSELPQVNLICSDGDTASLVARVQSHALAELFQALEALRQATPNKGGHRERAMALIQQAVVQVQQGIDFASRG
jgi:LysR family nitrogen assimilation transcriptional regulator